MENIPIAMPMQFVFFTVFAYFRALEPDATRRHKALAVLLMIATTAACIAYCFFNAPRDPPPTIHPNDILAISFPPTHAAFANGTGVPAHWHVVCAWPDQWSSCAYADVDDYSAGVTSMPCHMRAPKTSRDAVDIGHATVRCSVQWRDRHEQHHIVPYVVQNSCNVTIGSTHRPWIARDPTAADALLAEHAAALERAQIVGGRSVLPIVACDLYSGAFLRHGQQAVSNAVAPLVEAVNLLDRMARTFYRGMVVGVNELRDVAHQACVTAYPVHYMVARIAGKFGIPAREGPDGARYPQFCAGREVRFETTYSLPSTNCTYVKYPKCGEYSSCETFRQRGFSMSFLVALVRARFADIASSVIFFPFRISFMAAFAPMFFIALFTRFANETTRQKVGAFAFVVWCINGIVLMVQHSIYADDTSLQSLRNWDISQPYIVICVYSAALWLRSPQWWDRPQFEKQ